MAGKMITLKELAEHTDKESLWLLIDNCVYDVTKFIDEHPGGEEVLLEQAGKDATEPFNDVGHSSDAKTLMKDYKIGELPEDERKKISKKSDGSDSCVWFRPLIPVAIALAVSFLLYKYYMRCN